MNIAGLLTSAGINIGLCVLFLSLYSILRKQPGHVGVFFGRWVGQHLRPYENRIERFVPSASWILKAWETTEEELLASAGLDAVVFIKIVVFSIQIFSIAAVACLILVLPSNYYGKQMEHAEFHSEEMEIFTIVNVQEGSRWFWTHVVALYVITCSTCTLLYFNYKNITNLRLAYISRVPANLSHFTVFVRSIPLSSQDSYSDSVKKFFTKYYASSYLSHQMVQRCGKIYKLMSNAEKMYKMLKSTTDENQEGKPSFVRCGLCGEISSSFRILSNEDSEKINNEVHNVELSRNQKEYPAAFVFFKTRYGAFTASQVLQSSNPMLWVTNLAPDPFDVYWSNLWIPYRQLWIRKIATRIAAVAFMLLFILPVTIVQALTDARRLARTFPFLKKILKWKFMTQVVEGYLPSVILMLFLYSAPPLMMLFSAVEGSISRIGRKRSASCKVLYFTIWNVFFVNIFSGTIMKQLESLSYLKNIPIRLGQAVPSQAILFKTYIMTSGWASLSVELLQPFMLLAKLFSRYILKKDTSPDGSLSFPYHTEVPRVLLFGLIGLTCSVLAPLITPFLLVYFLLAYLVYRNQAARRLHLELADVRSQVDTKYSLPLLESLLNENSEFNHMVLLPVAVFLNVYIEKYESGGQFWPIAHNSTIFSLVLAQIIAIGVFGLKKSPVASGFTIPLVICTILFNEYCKNRFSPLFKRNPAEVLIDMDFQDEQNGRIEEIHRQLPAAYCQFTITSQDFCRSGHTILHESEKIEEDPMNKNLENAPSIMVYDSLDEDQPPQMNVREEDPSNLQVVLHSPQLLSDDS